MIVPSSNLSTCVRTHRGHASGCLFFVYTFRVCGVSSESRSLQVMVVARRNKLVNFKLIFGTMKLNSEGSKLSIWLKDIIDSWRNSTILKLVSSLNRETPSSLVGIFSD